MEAGRTKLANHNTNLIHAIVVAADEKMTDEDVEEYEKSACPSSGMFTANSMNCLTEVLGLALPGNGSLLATHKDREELFLEAGRTIVEITKRHYEEDDYSVLPRNIANFDAFENAMSMDIAMGGSTNTILHLLAAAQEGEIDFTLDDIDRLSRQVPNLCKAAPAIDRYHMEDIHRAGGMMGILGELRRGKLLNTSVQSVHSKNLDESLDQWDVVTTNNEAVKTFYKAGPAGIRTQTAFSQDTRYETLDVDRKDGCIRSVENAYSQDGGLAVLYGNIAEKGCIVKTAGVEEKNWVFSGPARVFESQDSAVEAILGNKIVEGDVVIIRYEGPKGGPGMQEMLYPTSYLKSKGIGSACALLTDGRFSGGTSGLSIGHASPEAAEGGNIALVEEGDEIQIDIPNRLVHLNITDAVLSARREAMEAKGPDAWLPTEKRTRVVSSALKAYAALTISADRGAVRDVSQLKR